jgi:hypothetical protein
MVFAMAFGPPLGLVVIQTPSLPQGSGRLWLVLLVVFIGLASALPALFYFLFERQRLGALQERFYRDVTRLDPSVETLTDAKALYGTALEEVYGRSDADEQRDAQSVALGVPLIISTLLIAMGWCLTLIPTGERLTTQLAQLASSGPQVLLQPSLTPLGFGFLGAYFFAVNLTFRRYVRADLGLKAYNHITVRLLVTYVLVWVTSTALSTASLPAAADAPLDRLMLVTAFGIGVFPEIALTIIQDLLGRAGRKILRLREEHPLTNLEGVTLYDQARLLEEGIENIENLAHHNLIDLILRTRIPTARLVDLVDQAILYLHLYRAGFGAQADPKTRLPDAIDTLRQAGIRTTTDLLSVYPNVPESLKPKTPDGLGVQGAGQASSGLDVIVKTLRDDAWMPYLDKWTERLNSGDQVWDLGRFLKVAVPSSNE